MNTSTLTLTGVVPPVCDAEAGQERLTLSQMTYSTDAGSSTGSPFGKAVFDQTDFLPAGRSPGKHGFCAQKLRSFMTEVCAAIRSALDDERGTAEDSLRRATEILDEISVTGATGAAPRSCSKR